MTILVIALYLCAIVAANLAIVQFGPSVAVINAFVLIAFDLASRDHLHDAWRGNPLKIGALLAAGSLLSYALNQQAGPIALASFVAFAVSGAGDALVYQALRRRAYLSRANGSNVIGATLDSILFPLLAFGWPPLWPVMIGQFVAKVIGGALWSLLFARLRQEAA